MESGLVLLVGLSTESELALRTAVPEAVYEVFPGPAAAQRSVASRRPAVAVVSLEGDLDAAFRLVKGASETGARIVVLGSTKDADLILRAMREGAHEFLGATETQRLGDAVREQIRPSRLPGLGGVVTLFPAKGGVGSTTTAVNLAGCWREAGARVCILDLNLTMGDVLGFLDLDGGYAISDVLGNLGRLDRELLQASILHHRSGIDVLAQCDKLEEADRVDPKLMHALLGFLRQHYDVVLVDGLRSFDELALATLDASDRVLLVFTQEVPAVRDAHRCVDLLRRLGHDDPKLKLVVNRYQKGAMVTKEIVAETTGLRVWATVANDYQAVARAVQRGALLVDEAPRAQITRDFQKLHGMLGEAPKASAPGRRSLLGRLFSFGTATHGAR